MAIGDDEFGPGVTSSTITIGVPLPRGVFRDDDAVARHKRWYQAAARSVNAAGGARGRALRFQFWEFSDQDYATYEQRDAAWCEQFTETTPVFAVVVGNGGTPGLIACLARRGVLAVYGPTSQWDSLSFQRFPNLVAPTGLSLERQAAVYSQSLVEQGFFQSGDRVGLISWDEPHHDRAVAQVIAPTLERADVGVIDHARVEPPRSWSDNARAIADGEAIIARWQQQGINKAMLFLDRSAAIVFMNLALSHNYHPAYGLVGGFSGATEGVPKTSGLTSASTQLRGAMGVGWTPASDISWTTGLTMPPATERCRSSMRASGAEYQGEDDAFWGSFACDATAFLAAAIEAGGTSITMDSFRKGMEKLGTGFASAQTFATRFTGGRRDGAAGYRPYSWDGGCGCFQYTAPPYDAG